MLIHRIHGRLGLAPLSLILLLALACSAGPDTDGEDAGRDAGLLFDAGTDAGPGGDAGSTDGGSGPDAGADAGPDAGADAGTDGGSGSGCTTLTGFTGFAFYASVGFYAATPVPALGGAEADQALFEFYTDQTGIFDLAAPGNDNYETCEQCLVIIEDNDGSNSVRDYFQQSGTMTLEGASPSTGGLTRLVLDTVVLVEVTIDQSTFVSTPVPGGACLEIPTATLTP